jgi:hypothetical protein
MRIPEILLDKRLSTHLMMQPAVFSGFVHGGKSSNDDIAHGTGFLGRCLIAKPASVAANIRPGTFEKTGNTAIKDATARLKDAVAVELVIKEDTFNDLELVTLRSGPEAFDAIETACVEIDHLSAAGQKWEIVRPFAGKSRDHVLRIAACFLVAKCLLDEGLLLQDMRNPEHTPSLDLDVVERAVQVVRWYLDEQARIMGTRSLSAAERDAHEILVFLHRHRISVATKSDLKDKKQVFRGDRFHRAADILAQNGWLVTRRMTRGNRQVLEYEFRLVDDVFDNL